MIPTEGEARAILAPYHSLIASVIDDAWAEWKLMRAWRSDRGLAPLLYQRTISNIIFDAIARRAIPKFRMLDKVHVELDAQTFKILFNGLCARFKKGGDDKLGCNIPTQAALAFMDADALLPGTPPETGKVEFIWLPNELWTDLGKILVVARDGDRLVWEYEVRREAGEKVIPLPTRPMEPDAGEPLVTPKPSVKPSAESK
jgi:hypothetical protein